MDEGDIDILGVFYMANINAILFQIQALSQPEQKNIAESILKTLKGESSFEDSSSARNPVCRKCGSETGISKYGKDKNGNQRFRCNHCGTVFTATSYSVISHSHCDLSKWEKYIECLLLGLSLEKCSILCDISIRTAFLWRHKILSILQNDQTNRVLSGIVETDDMFFSVSYKGNHKNSTHFVMPRDPHKRGTDTKVPPSAKTCVLCAVERGGQSYGEVMGIGVVNSAKLDYAFKNRLCHDALVVSDKAHPIKSYFMHSPNELVQVASHVGKLGSPPEIKGTFHIQNVNNMHSRIRSFMRGYNGVSTKYLNHYISLFVWIENYKKVSDINFEKELMTKMRQSNTYISAKIITSLPIIPSVA